MTFSIEMLPAARGDSLWIEYGPSRKRHRIIIDGGVWGTGERLRARIEALPKTRRRFDLLVITHIDLDHIAGIIALLRDPPEGFRVDDLWFNGWEQLIAAEDEADDGILGAKLGERLSAWIRERRYPLNKAFDDGPAGVRNSEGALPSFELRGGMKVTVLGPGYDRLRRLRTTWEKEIREAQLTPGAAGEILEGIAHPEEADDGILGGRIDIEKLAESKFREDTSRANASSIALLAEYDGRRCIFAGDAFASDLAAAVRRVTGEKGIVSEGRLAVDALKLSHHGGRKNTSSEFLDLLDCPNYLVSTDGSVYSHPHEESIARVIVHGATAGPPALHFNARSGLNEVWDDKRLSERGTRYTARFGTKDTGLVVEL